MNDEEIEKAVLFYIIFINCQVTTFSTILNDKFFIHKIRNFTNTKLEFYSLF